MTWSYVSADRMPQKLLWLGLEEGGCAPAQLVSQASLSLGFRAEWGMSPGISEDNLEALCPPQFSYQTMENGLQDIDISLRALMLGEG